MTKRLIKTLPINGVGIDIDLTNYHPIVEHPKFRRLGRVQQVPLATDIYEGCTHTRREHCIGSFYFASQISERDEVELTDQEKIDYVVSALIHDDGHGPFSHVIENVTRPEMEHDEINIEIAREMSRELKECGADPDNVVEIMSKKSDISPMVGSVLGAEKLDYVSMDLYHCGLGTVPAIERLITSAVFRGDGTRKYGIEYENHGGSSVVNFLKAWWDGHTNIYLHRDVEIPRVMLQRAVGYEFTPDQYKRLFEMDDYE